jgi:hypothetical protein
MNALVAPSGLAYVASCVRSMGSDCDGEVAESLYVQRILEPSQQVPRCS